MTERGSDRPIDDGHIIGRSVPRDGNTERLSDCALPLQDVAVAADPEGNLQLIIKDGGIYRIRSD